MARTPLWISRRISMARLLVCAVLVMSGLAISTSPAQAASNRLPNGNKLIAGSCITDSGSNGSTKFCVGKNYNLNLYHNGNICWSWQANTHLSGPDAFVKKHRCDAIGHDDVRVKPHTPRQRYRIPPCSLAPT